MIPIIPIFFAIALPIWGIKKWEKHGHLSRPYVYSISSFAFCALAMLQEIYTLKSRAINGDISGILDTVDAVLMICVILCVITLACNLILMVLVQEARNNITSQNQ